MNLTNTTKMKNKTIRELINFAKPKSIHNFDVMIKNYQYGRCRGRAYTSGSSYHYSPRPFIVVSIQKSDTGYPLKTEGNKGYISVLLLSKTEHLLYILAHELRHLWQKKVPKGYRVWGAKGKFSERDADAFAIKIVRSWRKKRGEELN